MTLSVNPEVMLKIENFYMILLYVRSDLTCPGPKIEKHTDSGKSTSLVEWQHPVPTDYTGYKNAEATCDSLSGTRFPIGETNVTCTAIDRRGVNKTCFFHVVVSGTHTVLSSNDKKGLNLYVIVIT